MVDLMQCPVCKSAGRLQTLGMMEMETCYACDGMGKVAKKTPKDKKATKAAEEEPKETKGAVKRRGRPPKVSEKEAVNIIEPDAA